MKTLEPCCPTDLFQRIEMASLCANMVITKPHVANEHYYDWRTGFLILIVLNLIVLTLHLSSYMWLWLSYQTVQLELFIRPWSCVNYQITNSLNYYDFFTMTFKILLTYQSKRSLTNKGYYFRKLDLILRGYPFLNICPKHNTDSFNVYKTDVCVC